MNLTQQYNVLAQFLKDAIKRGTPRESVQRVADVLCDSFEKTNPNFKRHNFLGAVFKDDDHEKSSGA